MQSSSPRNQNVEVNGRRPSLPEGLRIYAVGDIHGRLDLLNALLSLIESDMKLRPAARSVAIFLGDYIDRGPSSREVIDRLIEYRTKQECLFLRGNHESIAVNCLSDRSMMDQWLRLGGRETLLSYSIPAVLLTNGKQAAELQLAFHDAVPQTHFRFFAGLQNSSTFGDFFFVHAGVRPNVDLSQQKESDLLWIRNEFLSSSSDFGKIVVHGHTPTAEVEVKANRINIDTGAFATGRLTCLVIEGEALSVIDTGDIEGGLKRLDLVAPGPKASE